MKYQALYRKYRPKSFEDVVGQDIVIKTLKNSLKNNKISHAYMFSGPRGTGKTSIAKLFAKTVNCINLNDGDSCNSCKNCLSVINNECTDIIEIDAASNNGVDEIREIRNKITLVPNELKYKVYIIDEVHMLSIGAFNALLKTLEEPPSHVIFILATTDPHKVPVTIISRCQCFEFKRISNDNIVSKLNHICRLEAISIDADVLERIAVYADGGLRDAIGLLDKLVSYTSDKITMCDLNNICGLLSYDYQEKFLDMIFNSKSLEIIEEIDTLYDHGKDFVVFTQELMELLKKKLIISLREGDNSYIDFYLELISIFNDMLVKLRQTDNVKIVFEVALISYINNKNDIKIISREIIFDRNEELVNKVALNNVNIVEKSKTEEVLNVIDDKNNKSLDDYNKMKDIYINNTFVSASKDKKMAVISKWNELNEYVLDTEFGAAACYLLDSIVEAVGENNMILSVKCDSAIERIIGCLPKIYKLLEKIYGKFYKIAILNDIEWKKVRNDFISNKDTKKYVYIDDSNISDDSISQKLELGDNNLVSDIVTSDIVSEAINIFGENVVEIK